MKFTRWSKKNNPYLKYTTHHELFFSSNQTSSCVSYGCIDQLTFLHLTIFYLNQLTYYLSNTGNLTGSLGKGFLNFKQNLQLSQQSTIIFKNFLSSQQLSFKNLTNRSFDIWHNWQCSFITFSLQYSTTTNLSNEKWHYNFLWQK